MLDAGRLHLHHYIIPFLMAMPTVLCVTLTGVIAKTQCVPQHCASSQPTSATAAVASPTPEIACQFVVKNISQRVWRFCHNNWLLLHRKRAIAAAQVSNTKPLLMQSGNFFQDGKRRVDYILTYPLHQEEHKDRRVVFEKNLLDGGAEIEYHFLEKDEDSKNVAFIICQKVGNKSY